jgi:hypothetical protein
MNDLIITSEMKELKKGLKDIKKEKASEFDDLVRTLLTKYGNRFARFEQAKSKDQIEHRFIGEFEDGVILTLSIQKVD